jgi:hypothetical protein
MPPILSTDREPKDPAVDVSNRNSQRHSAPAARTCWSGCLSGSADRDCQPGICRDGWSASWLIPLTCDDHPHPRRSGPRGQPQGGPDGGARRDTDHQRAGARPTRRGVGRPAASGPPGESRPPAGVGRPRADAAPAAVVRLTVEPCGLHLGSIALMVKPVDTTLEWLLRRKAGGW